MGTKYTLARGNTDPAQSEVFRGASGVAVFQNPDVFNRAWAVHEIVPIRDLDQGLEFMGDHLDELRSKAVSWNAAPRSSRLARMPKTWYS